MTRGRRSTRCSRSRGKSVGKPTLSGRWTSTPYGITYERSGGSWSIRFDEITAIGECTNELGPFADDYYICFVGLDGVRWLEGSFYAEGRDELLTCLAQHFGIPFDWQLIDSTTFRSRVMWPPALQDRPLFDYREPDPVNRVSAWLRRIGLKPNTNVQTVAEDVRRHIVRVGA